MILDKFKELIIIYYKFLPNSTQNNEIMRYINSNTFNYRNPLNHLKIIKNPISKFVSITMNSKELFENSRSQKSFQDWVSLMGWELGIYSLEFKVLNQTISITGYLVRTILKSSIKQKDYLALLFLLKKLWEWKTYSHMCALNMNQNGEKMINLMCN